MKGVHDPSGSALNYLLGGAHFVVGNLWDVTDKDIDKLSVECMKSVLFVGRQGVTVSDTAATSTSTKGDDRGAGGHQHQDSKGSECDAAMSIPAALSKSREICKLKHAVGSSPVMYGLPTRITST